MADYKSDRYKELKAASDKMRETKDCAVMAVAVAGDLTYEDAHCLMELCGRKPRTGTHYWSTCKALKFLDIKTEDCTELFKMMGAKTVRTLGRVMRGRKGVSYLVRTSHHIFTVKDGEICDWTEGRLHRIQTVERLHYETAANDQGS